MTRAKRPETVTVRLPTEVLDRLRQFAEAEDRPLGAMVRRLVVKAMDDEESSDGNTVTA